MNATMIGTTRSLGLWGILLASFRYVPALNGIRAFAVVAVLLSHALPTTVPGGKAGVLVFFALSGFLITSILLREREGAGRVSLKNFYIRRALRLFPAMVLASAAYAVLALTLGDRVPGQATLDALPAGILYFLNWYNIFTDGGVGLIGHYWSLSVEEQFYFVWPLVLLLAFRLFRVRGVLWTAAAGAAVSYALKWVVLASSHRQTGTDFAADALLVGCALACAYVLYPRRVAAMSGWLLWPAMAGIAAATILGNSTETADASDMALFSRLWWPVASLGACVLVASCTAETLPRWLAAVFEWKPIAYLGKISYGVYLYHMIMLVLVPLVIPGSGIIAAVRLMIVCALTVGLAALSFETVEKRLLARKPKHRELLAALDSIPIERSRVARTTDGSSAARRVLMALALAVLACGAPFLLLAPMSSGMPWGVPLELAVIGFMAAMHVRSRPRSALALWLVILCLTPFWLAFRLGTTWTPGTLAFFVVLPALLTAKRSRFTRLDYLMIWFIAAATVATFLFGASMGAYVTVFVQWLPAYFVGRYLAPAAGWPFTFRLIAVSGVVMGSWSLLEFATGLHIFEGFVGPMGDPGNWHVIQYRGAYARSEASFGHSIALGGYLALTVPFIFASRFRGPKTLLLIGIVAGGTLVTFSRGAIIGFLVATALSVVAMHGGTMKPRARLAWVFTFVVAGVLFVPPVLSLFDDVQSDLDPSAQYRSDLVSTILQDMHPFGPADGTFVNSDGRDVYRSFGSIDNTYVLWVTQFGWVPVAVLLLGLVAVAFMLARRTAHPAVVAVAAQAVALASVAPITQYQMAVWFLIGMAGASGYARSALRTRAEMRGRAGSGDAVAGLHSGDRGADLAWDEDARPDAGRHVDATPVRAGVPAGPEAGVQTLRR